MILPIYRSCVSVVQRSNGDIPSMWHVCRFTPIEPRCKTSSGIWYVETDGCSRPAIHVKTPPLCKMTEQLGKPRLATPYDSYGHDATSVYHLATNGLRGFSMATDAVAQVAATGREIDSQSAPEPGPPLPKALSVVVEVFSSSDAPDTCKSFIEASPPDRIGSTWEPDEIRTWPTREAAQAWLESVDLAAPDARVPVGIHWLRARVAEIDLDTLRAVPPPEWLRGVRFGYRFHPGRTSVGPPLPATETPHAHAPSLPLADDGPALPGERGGGRGARAGRKAGVMQPMFAFD